MSSRGGWLLMFSLFVYRVVLVFSLWTRITSGSMMEPRDRLALLPPPSITANLLSSLERSTTTTKFDAFPVFSGTLHLCPAGGPSFFEAFSIVCPMRRRKRSISRAPWRKMSASSSEELPLLMDKCCKKGCNFEALHKMCDPFDF